ncbi:MAG: nucleoside recognition domain-containing protein, partial [Clostridia bacterium]
VFHLTFDTVGRSLSVLLATALDICTARLDHILLTAGTCRPLHDLLIYGICPGIGSVLSFVPLIAVLFCLLAILEDCGYFSYAAALFDSGMSRLGLSGQCIVPLIMGFGCAVPAVMSASSMLEGNKNLTTYFHDTVHVMQRQAARILCAHLCFLRRSPRDRRLVHLSHRDHDRYDMGRSCR